MRRLLALLLLLPVTSTAFAAESFDGCAGFIDSLPATITTQGVWCLRGDLSTSITSGAAITVAANNVTLDCNGFKVGGLGAGPQSIATGVLAANRLNGTVRNCTVRGFLIGIQLGGAGHAVEENLVDQSLATGIWVTGDNNVVRRNRVFDTGSPDTATGMIVEGDVIENTVSGVSGPESVIGIIVEGTGVEVRENRVRHISPASGTAVGIQLLGQHQTLADNRVVNAGSQPGAAIKGNGTVQSFCTGNTVAGFEAGITDCQDLGGNGSH